MLVGANDLLFFFVALETLGLGAILLASYARLNQKSNEAGIKYLITSAVSTATLLLGISFLYGLTGLTNFDEVAFRLYQLNIIGALSPALIALIAVCLVAAVSFKLAAVPFHNWSPDVYTGAPTVTTAFLSVVSKTAAFGLAIRLFNSVFNNDLITILFAVIAVLSIIIGNYVGLIQMISRASAKRLLAYSSIAQAGYLIIGLAVFQKESIAALVMYLSVYALMNTGVFLGLIYFEQNAGSDSIYDMAGLIKKRPWMAIATSLCLINLAGLPFIPAGFIAKFYLFSSAYSSTGLTVLGIELGQILAVVGLLGSLVGLYYYLYLVKIMVVDEPSTVVKQLEDTDSSFCMIKLVQSCGPVKGYGLINISMALTVMLMIGFGIFGMNWFRLVASQVVSGLS
jgi:NAD(P)H-quinone oxidoreductase subunit 2